MTNRDSSIAKAYRTFVDWVRNDPQLTRLLGKPDRLWACLGESWERDEPTDAQCPVIRFTPRPGPSDWHVMQSTGTDGPSHACPILIDVQTYVKGTDVTASMEIAEALYLACYPQDSTRKANLKTALLAVGVSRVTTRQMAWGPDISGTMLKGTGSITLDMVLES